MYRHRRNVWHLEQFTGPSAALKEPDALFDERTACDTGVSGDRECDNWQFKRLSKGVATPSLPIVLLRSGVVV